MDAARGAGLVRQVEAEAASLREKASAEAVEEAEEILTSRTNRQFSTCPATGGDARLGRIRFGGHPRSSPYVSTDTVFDSSAHTYRSARVSGQNFPHDLHDRRQVIRLSR